MNYLNGPLECETMSVFTRRKKSKGSLLRCAAVKFNFSETNWKQTNKQKNVIKKNKKHTPENVVATLLIQTWDYFMGCFLREDCTLNVDQIHSWQNNLGQKTRSQSLPSHWIMYNRCMCNICKVLNTFLACLASRRIEINLYSTTTFSIFLFQKCNIPLTRFDFRTLHWQIFFFSYFLCNHHVSLSESLCCHRFPWRYQALWPQEWNCACQPNQNM